MIYDLSIQLDRKKAIKRLKTLFTSDKRIALKEAKQRRTLSQNSYIHVLFTLYGIEFGYTLEEAKIHLKRMCPDMVYVKNDELFLKQTSQMDKDEIREFIDWIRNHASVNGCYLPSSEEYLENQFDIDKEIHKHKEFM